MKPEYYLLLMILSGWWHEEWLAFSMAFEGTVPAGKRTWSFHVSGDQLCEADQSNIRKIFSAKHSATAISS